ncbi:O-antigen ligase [Arenibacter sp. ARW7G5Y1]|uniref:O-antigen ligase family protein n=1 Tax=Arenibacter sp. ARW7G5Y1 TaxID=2135619 RepID=UPI000D765F1C|nr:O-antigen ligase family protein [Arenibacter sp. ARW7G5Y1]PXX27829.1 O-antigen ligase-like membrane protein [Arenibacter sp. ARW7G5Y1]|tara:strand:+ start:755 stop:2044 length:1290 start_codon:yes stop_codon:yes gene_type:complete
MGIKKIFLDKERIKIYLLILIVVTIPYKINIGNAALILAIIYNLLFFERKNFQKIKSFSVIFPITFFLASVLSSLMSKDYLEGIGQLDRQLLLLLIVIILANIQLTEKIIEKVLKCFFFSTIIGTLILLFNLLINIIYGATFKNLTFHDFTALYDQHPVYYALYLSLSIFYGLDRLINYKVKNKVATITGLLILFFGLVLCASKAVIFIDVIIIAILILYRIEHTKKKILYGTLLTVIAIGTINLSFVKERFLDGLTLNDQIISFTPSSHFGEKKNFTYLEKTKISDLELRILFLKIGIYHLIDDDKVLFGYGQGDVQDFIDYHLFTYNLGPNWFEGFNVHNQYLHILLTYGIFVLIFFMTYLIFSFTKAIRNKDHLHLFFLISMCFVFIFEVSLFRNKGIIFFYFFNTLFLLKQYRFENCHSRNTRSA